MRTLCLTTIQMLLLSTVFCAQAQSPASSSLRPSIVAEQRVESILMKEHGWTKAEATRSLAEVAAHLQTEVEPMLAGKADPTLHGSPVGG